MFPDKAAGEKLIKNIYKDALRLSFKKSSWKVNGWENIEVTDVKGMKRLYSILKNEIFHSLTEEEKSEILFVFGVDSDYIKGYIEGVIQSKKKQQ